MRYAQVIGAAALSSAWLTGADLAAAQTADPPTVAPVAVDAAPTAQDGGGSGADVSPAAPAADNSGQDPTRPLTRVDLRNKYQGDSDGVHEDIITLRADKPFVLGGGWTLGARIDLPVTISNAPGPHNPQKSDVFGMTDSLVQALVITPPQGNWAFAFGGQIVFPTGSEPQFTTGKWQLVPTVAAVRQLSELSPGSFVGIVARDSFDFAGSSSRAHINIMTIQPVFNWALPQRWFATFGPEIRFDTRNDWHVFFPFDVTIGKKITNNIVASLQADVPMIDTLKDYNWQMEARIGFFF